MQEVAWVGEDRGGGYISRVMVCPADISFGRGEQILQAENSKRPENAVT